MCGFLVATTERADGTDACADIAHRGPDALGHLQIDAGVPLSLHFRRLAIVDLDPRSDQPFGDRRRGVLLYNGEIYNADELRLVLKRRGVAFHTRGDTEVLYELLLQPDWSKLLDRVDGMFSFVLVVAGELRYGRDRFGVKPLYEAVSSNGNLLGLSSQVAALKAAGILGGVDPGAVAASAMFLWVPPPATGWRGCALVEPGTVWTRSGVDAPPRLAWRAPTATAAAVPDLAEAVRLSLARQVQADVPVALLLSGGLDSSWLAVELSRAGHEEIPLLAARQAAGLTAGAEPFQEDAPFAERVATSLGRQVQWSDLNVDLLGAIPEMVAALEQPFGDPAAITLMRLSDAAAERATVLLSGVGVEELFLGYERYQAIKALEGAGRSRRVMRAALPSVPMPARLRERVAKLNRLLHAAPNDWPWVSQSYYSAGDWPQLSPDVALDQVVCRHREVTEAAIREGGGSLLEAAARTDRELFLPGLNLMYADRASMHASVELRVPFLGEPVVAAAVGHPARDHVGIGNGKRLFRRVAASAGVPEFVIKRSKTGFGAPVRSIMRTHGKLVWEGISRSELFDDLFNRSFVEEMFAAHVSGRSELGLPLFGLASLAVWWDDNVTGSTVSADALRDISARASA